MSNELQLWTPVMQALHCLYNNANVTKANEWLMEFQSRKVSMEGQKDGSSWWTSLMLVSTSSRYALFGAQTLHHRLRRMNLSNAIDWENESTTTIPTCFHPTTTAITTTTSLLEEEQKVKLSMNTLSQQYHLYSDKKNNNNNDNNNMAIQATLASTIILLHLRWHFHSQQHQQQPQEQSFTKSLWNQIQHVSNGWFIIACIPDTLLIRHNNRIGSFHPQYYQQVCTELHDPSTIRTILSSITTTTTTSNNNNNNNNNNNHNSVVLLQRWAEHVTIPWDCIEPFLPTTTTTMDNHPWNMYISILELSRQSKQDIYNSIFSFNEITGDYNNQTKKKRQGNKSKKRQLQRYNNDNTNNSDIQMFIDNLFQQRQQVTMKLGLYYLPHLSSNMTLQQLLSTITDNEEEVSGEGAIACIGWMISSMFPQLLLSLQPTSEEAYICIFQLLQQLCNSTNASVRRLSMEHVAYIHSTLASKSIEVPQVIWMGLGQCGLALADKCAYPPNYFDTMQEESHDELEVERNDVRDLVRTMGTTPILLQQFLQHIHSTTTVIKETWVHLLSALAKPITTMIQTNDAQSTALKQTIFNCLSAIANILLNHLTNQSQSSTDTMRDVFPMARLFCLSVASYEPFFTYYQTTKDDETSKICFQICMWCIVSCVESIPELLIPSSYHSTTDNTTSYNIRGAMRSPGGEDHVGCIALSRCSPLLLLQKDDGNFWNSFLQKLTFVHQQLHQQEHPNNTNNCMGVTTPKSRRILLTVLTQMAHHHHHHDNDPSLLQGLFQQSLQPLLQITSISLNQNSTNITEHDLFTCCESILDIASFPSSLVATLFDDNENNHEISRCLEQIIQIITLGYTELLSTQDPNHQSTLLIQWSRLRASVIFLFQTSANPTLPSSIVNVLSTLIHTECHAAMIQLNSNTNGKVSNLFHKCVIGDDILPAGVYLMIHSNVLSSILKNNNNDLQQQMVAIQACLSTLNASKTYIFQLLLHQSISPSNSNNRPHVHYIDPTSTIAEALFTTLKSILLVIQKSPQLQQNQQLMLDLQTCICETLVFCIQLIWIKPLEKDLRKQQQQEDRYYYGMSLDGPQTLIMMDFMELALLIFNTCTIVKYISSTLKNQQQYTNNIHIQMIQNQQNQIMITEEELVGGAIWISSLYRGTIGVLPPWILERIPKVYQLLFDQQLCQRNVSTFCILLQLGGQYCGPDVISEKALHDFVSKCHDLLIQNKNPWRQFKAFFKAVCGGKKKATTFQLKPQPTCWNCDRI